MWPGSAYNIIVTITILKICDLSFKNLCFFQKYCRQKWYYGYGDSI